MWHVTFTAFHFTSFFFSKLEHELFAVHTEASNNLKKKSIQNILTIEPTKRRNNWLIFCKSLEELLYKDRGLGLIRNISVTNKLEKDCNTSFTLTGK
jgi:hypothetical protein